MDELRKTGRVTIPTDLDVVPETLEILKKWGADAIRDCDGTDFPQQLKDADAKIYSTYYTTRKDNAWAKANPDEVQQCYIMTGFYTAPGDTVTIPLMKGISPELMQVNTNDDITRWWEVMDRTTGQPVPPEKWSYADGSVTVTSRRRFTPLDDTAIHWTLSEDGKTVSEGITDALATPAQGSTTIKLFDPEKVDSLPSCLLTLSFVSTKDYPWAEKGFETGFEIVPSLFPFYVDQSAGEVAVFYRRDSPHDFYFGDVVGGDGPHVYPFAGRITSRFPTVGDILHIGIVVEGDTVYNERSPERGHVVVARPCSTGFA